MELLILIHQLSEVTVTANQIKNWTEKDSILSQVHCFVLDRWPNIVDNKQTPRVRKETQRKRGNESVYVPANMTHFFQPLDLTVDGCAKQRMRKEFVTYCSSAVKQQLDSGKQLEDIEVDFRLSVLKPLHEIMTQ